MKTKHTPASKREVTLGSGNRRKTVDLDCLIIPDCWHVYTMLLKDNPQAAQMTLECWHIAHDLKNALIDQMERKEKP